MKILITGISGFVARHYLEMLAATGQAYTIAGIYNNHKPDFNEYDFGNIDLKFYKLNLLSELDTEKLIVEFKPNYILHLAAKSSVAESWKKPFECLRENPAFLLGIVEALRKHHLDCRVLSVGSVEEYGIIQSSAENPLHEKLPSNPANPYGIAKDMQCKLAHVYEKNYDLDIIHTRSFNHFGRYQKPVFVLSSFIKQIAEQIKAEKKNIELEVGNIDVVRDFTDVRDIVQAYHSLLLNGAKGEVYNVCSGTGYCLRDLLIKLSEIINFPLTYTIHKEYFRPSENPIQVGSNQKITEATGWKPKLSIDLSLTDFLNYWLSQSDL